MLKTLLFSLLLSVSIGPALAQNPVTDESLASQQLKQRLRQKYLTSDTAQALINLYGRRQAGGVGWMVAAVLSSLRLAVGASGTTNPSNSPYYTPSNDSGGNAAAAILVGLPIVAYGASKELRYSNARLNQVLTTYAAGQPLPHALRRKLKPRFFSQPIVQYKEVKYKPIK